MVSSLPGRLQMTREIGYLNNTGFTIAVLTFDGHIDVVPSKVGKGDGYGTFTITVTTKAHRELLLSGLNDDDVPWETKIQYKEMLDTLTSQSGSDSCIKSFVVSTEEIIGTKGVYIEGVDLVLFNTKQLVHPVHPRQLGANSNVNLVSPTALTLEIEIVTDDAAQADTYINIGEAQYVISPTTSCSRINGVYVTTTSRTTSESVRYDSIDDFIQSHPTKEAARLYAGNRPAKVMQLEKEVVDLTKTVTTLRADYIKTNTELQLLKRNDLFSKEFISSSLSTKDKHDDSIKKIIEANCKISELEAKAITDEVSNNRKLASDLLKFTSVILGNTIRTK
jgi:hypothetical protein